MARGRRGPGARRPRRGARKARRGERGERRGDTRPGRRPRRGGEPERRRAERPRPALPPRDEWIGILGGGGRRWRVTPYRDDALWSISVARDALEGAREGDVVAVVPQASPKRRRRANTVPSRGRVSEVLGRPGDAEADFRAVVWRRGLPVEFPPEALAQAESLPAAPDGSERARRVDLRDRDFVTIDPASARDHDDAVCVEPAEGGARLLVAIADVSFYVTPGSPIDREALHRGNSVYFPDRAIPMLPERLSSELCSLRPDEERLAFVVELLFDGRGRVRRRGFYPARIRSRARLVYDDAARVMDEEGDGGLPRPLVEGLLRLRDLTLALRRKRMEAGSIDFDLPSAEIVLGDDRRPVELVEAPRTVAHRAVEEAMLAANRAVAEALVEAGAPAVFRNHEAPLPQDLEDLCELLAAFDLFRGAPDDLLDPRRLAEVLERVEGRPEEHLVNQVVLRSMRQARYEARSRGHFALAFPHYLHFTSPIRRYADLVVHRALADLLDPAAAPRVRAERLERVADRLSDRERLAVEAEREMVDLKQCAFMLERVGNRYAGTVSGVARHGLYVTLDDIFVDGLVHVSRLPGYFQLDERSHSLVARGGRRFRLGDRLAVRVASVDPVRARIDFALEEPGSGQRAARS